VKPGTGGTPASQFDLRSFLLGAIFGAAVMGVLVFHGLTGVWP
jgi:hypothetical protein